MRHLLKQLERLKKRGGGKKIKKAGIEFKGGQRRSRIDNIINSDSDEECHDEEGKTKKEEPEGNNK